MSRPNKIWFRSDIGWWMVTVGGRKIRLAQGKANKKAAAQKFHELMATQQARAPENPDARVADVVDAFLAWSKIHRSAETNRNHVWYGQEFAEHSGYLKAADLRPIHVTRWVDSHKWGPTTERNARRSIGRAFTWAVEEGVLRSNPLHGMKCPAAATRQRVMTDAEFRGMLRGSKRDFKVLLYALRMTGCRPKEARTLKWEQVLEDRWVLQEHKTAHSTNKSRVIYLIPPMRKLMAVLRRKGRSDYVFVNRLGRMWTRNAIRLRVQRLKERKELNLGDDLCCYLARHAFGTAAIMNGVDALTVAQLMGHNSLTMVQKVYVHLAGEHAHLHEAAQRATKPVARATPRPGESNQVE